MNDTGVIDSFLSVFTTYIDSGFGLLGGEVGFLSSTLIAIDVTIAALFWAWGADEDVLQRLVRKTLYIGTFAFIIGNFSNLATILFESFVGLGLQASGGALAMGEFMQPGTVAATGLDAGEPLLDATADLLGPVGLFTNFVQIAILLIAWLIVVLAFFILAIQIFITIVEFKLVTLAGFVLLPFAFFGRTAFMAERVLGHIISSGIKVLVLAVIAGIGTTLFTQFTGAGLGSEPTVEQVMAIALAALTLLGLGIFGPGIANGIVTGGPQLGAGAAAGTALAAGMTIAGGAAGARLTAGAAGRSLAGAATGGARAAGAATAAYSSGAAGRSGAASVAAGLASAGKGAVIAATSPLRRAAGSLKQSYAQGRGGTPSSAVGSASTGADGQPAWARAMRRRQTITQGATMTTHTLKGGDSHGGGAGPDISQKD
ncbi:P-type conjugative transfer protein TrbL [Sphingomonas fennica]|uniref:P-type conjugative transfer protein TrbL n=1 Tax=Edaphosphingomonas fennica TaxID=114404 RepID=A0A2T4I5J3_9SPHN|nr:P-type conjugative transfer protein TrbL [Sphingomonas fennica]PTD25489.1 P-type conjugative transfer protein TrbL [Sphingomonas fennica]